MAMLKPATNRNPADWSTTHGLSKTSAYKTWGGMIQRCTNLNNDSYRHYGGRGITVCKEWLKFEGFYRDMGDRPEGMSLDRIDPNGNYEPSNCRWTTSLDQQRNRRDTRKVTLLGKTKSLKEWADICGVDPKTIVMRIKREWPEHLIASMDGKKSNSVTRGLRNQDRNELGQFIR